MLFEFARVCIRLILLILQLKTFHYDNFISENRLRYAHGVISEYLSDDLSTKLCSHIGLTPLEEITGQKRKQLLTPSNNATSNDNKRSKILTSHDIIDDTLLKSNNGAVGALDLSKPEKVINYIIISFIIINYELTLLFCHHLFEYFQLSNFFYFSLYHL